MQDYRVALETPLLSDDEARALRIELQEWQTEIDSTEHGTSRVSLTIPAPSLPAAVIAAQGKVSRGALGACVEPAARPAHDPTPRGGGMPELLSTAETAELLGLDRQEVRDLCKRGELPHWRVGGVLVIAKTDALAQLAAAPPEDGARGRSDAGPTPRDDA